MPPLPQLKLPRLPAGLRPARRDFFLRPTVEVARQMLGAWLVLRRGRAVYGARLVEVEAYLGVEDPAAHSFGGRRTARVEPMYAAGGHLYVFLVYGIHHCTNLVTREAGVPEAVLLRAGEAWGEAAPRLLSGPAKLSRALDLDRSCSGRDLVQDSGFDLYPDPVAAEAIVAAPRVGVDYAGEAARWPLRFYLRDSRAVSRRG